MSSQSRLVAGVLLILLPTVEFGGASILSLLIGDPEYTQNELRQDLWRADVLELTDGLVLLPAAFFLSVLSTEAAEPNALIYLAYVGGTSLGVGLLVLGIGLIRGRYQPARR